MNPLNISFDLPSFANHYMREGIEKYQFIQGKGFGDVLTLSNANCIIYIQNFGEGLGFSFAASGDPETQFSLSRYLDAFVEGGRGKYWPEPPQALEFEQQFIHSLKCFNVILTSEVLSPPLGGDFSWVSRLKAFEDEYRRLANELNDLVILEHSEGNALFEKRMNGDLTWMDDVRRILAEQESES